MSKHTPGPWKICEESWSASDVYGKHRHIRAKKRGALVVNYGGSDADLSLICAAPDMLEALKLVMEWAKTPGDHGGNPYAKKFVKAAEKALAIAEGKGV